MSLKRETPTKTTRYILTGMLLFLGATQIKAQLTQTSSIAAPLGTVDSFNNGYTFAYATSGTPWNGALISFGGLVNRYDCQINADYGPAGGNYISFRTHNGDAANVWNGWKEIWHSGNLNRADDNFTANTINCTNVYTNGNLWSKHIVSLTNPWSDFVFKPSYNLRLLAEVKAYIDQIYHLPNVPSTTEVEKNGLNLGEMNKVLMQKVEKLTLYLIEKDKELIDQAKKIQQQNMVQQNQEERIRTLEESILNLTKSVAYHTMTII